MDTQGHSEMEITPSESHSHTKLLTISRELLVTHIRHTQCLVDNLLHNDYFSAEDAEIVGACPTQPDKVLVQGQETRVGSQEGLFPIDPSEKFWELSTLGRISQWGHF